MIRRVTDESGALRRIAKVPDSQAVFSTDACLLSGHIGRDPARMVYAVGGLALGALVDVQGVLLRDRS